MQDRLQSSDCARFLKALGDPDRLKIVQCLQPGPKAVGDICRELDSRIANVSHHLGLLKQAGVVSASKKGRFVIYELAPEVRKRQGKQALDVLDFGCCRVELGGKDGKLPPQPSEDTIVQISNILAKSVGRPRAGETAAPAGRTAARRGGTREIPIVNASFEEPRTAFFDTRIDGWTKEGDPSATGIFFNFPDGSPFPGSRFVANVDGQQLAAIAAQNPPGATPPALHQVLDGVVFEAGKRYELSLAIGLSSVHPPKTGLRPPAAIRFALVYTDSTGRHEVAARSVPLPELTAAASKEGGNAFSRLTRFGLHAQIPGPSEPCVGKPVGILITTAGNNATHDGHFIFDDVRAARRPAPFRRTRG